MIVGFGVLAFVSSVFFSKSIPVEAARVTRGPLVMAVAEEGRTRIRNRYIVSPTVAGFLRRVTVRAGDPVTAGRT